MKEESRELDDSEKQWRLRYDCLIEEQNLLKNRETAYRNQTRCITSCRLFLLSVALIIPQAHDEVAKKVPLGVGPVGRHLL
jgi:hypothetical protein